MINFRLHIALIALLMSTLARAQDVVEQTARSIGSAGIIGVSALENFEAVNPALMATTTSFDAFVSCAVPYTLPELAQINGKMVVNARLLNVALRVAKHGSDGSSMAIFGGGLSRDFNVFGIGVDYYAIVHTLPYSVRATSSFSRIGLYINPSEKLLLSVFVHNLEHRAFHYADSAVESLIEPMAVVALKWSPTKIFALLCELEKRFESQAVCKAAVVIRPVKFIDVTAGFSSAGHAVSLGAGYRLGRLGLNVGLNYHNKLGLSSGATVSYSVARK